MKKILLVFGMLFLHILMQAQLVWYFGNKAGIDFSGAVPVYINNGQQMDTGEGCTMAYDNQCSLLFYSDGISVWDKNNNFVKDNFGVDITGANGLKGSPTSTQSAIAVPEPNTNYNEFYLFTMCGGNDAFGLNYTMIHNCLSTPTVNNSQKNILLTPKSLRMTEKLTAFIYPGDFFWVITHDFSTDDATNGCSFYAYRVDQFGIAPPIISSIGTCHQLSPYGNANTQGQMKFSHDGLHLALTINATRRVELLDFDPATGHVTNPRRIQFPLYIGGYPNFQDDCSDCTIYGVEFSPNDQYLFISGSDYCDCNYNHRRIYQVNLNTFSFPYPVTSVCSGGTFYERHFASEAAIAAVPNEIAIIHNSGDNWIFGQLQLGPDNAIYVARTLTAGAIAGDYVSRIDNPDTYPATFTEQAVKINSPAYCRFGLPTLLQNYYPCSSTISGYKFNDLNGDGDWDSNDGENGLSGWIINLIPPIVPPCTTNASGYYEFTGLPAGTYTVTENQQVGWKQTFPSPIHSHTVTLDPGLSISLSFGNCYGIESPPGMKAWWPFDESTGTSAKDVMQYNNSANYVGNPIQEPAGMVAGCIQLNRWDHWATQEYLEVKDHGEINFGSGNFTIDAWVNLTDDQNDMDMILDKRTTNMGTPKGYCFYIYYNSYLKLDLSDGLTSYNYSSNPSQFEIDGNHWHHVAVTVDKNNPVDGIKFYIDGLPQGTASPPNINFNVDNTQNLFIGASQTLGYVFYGKLDEIELFERALDPTEIENIKNAGICGKHKPTGSICGFKFDDQNKDGEYTSGEPFLEGWTIELSGPSSATTTTDANGNYCFDQLWPGLYVVSEVQKPGWRQSRPGSTGLGVYFVPLPEGNNVIGISFGNYCYGVDPPSGMRAWWPFDEQNGSTTAKDIMGTNNVATYVGTPGNLPGKVAGCISFNFPTRITDYLVVKNDPELNFMSGKDFSIDAWVQPTDFHGDDHKVKYIIVDKMAYVGGIPYGYSFYLDNLNGLALEIADGTSPFPAIYRSSSHPFHIHGDWYHVAVTVNRDIDAGIKFYIDGILYGTEDPRPHQGDLTNTIDLHIAKGYDMYLPPYDFYFFGYLDEIEIFDRVLGEDEITDMYHSADCGKHKPTGKICGFKFNDVNGNGAYDWGEPKLAGWTIELSGTASKKTTTGPNGDYCFEDLYAGNYVVNEVEKPSWTQSWPASHGNYSIDLADAQEAGDINFGNRYCVEAPPDMNNWWPFDEKTGTTADDIAGTNNNVGNYVNSPLQNANGKVLGAIQFGNINQYVTVSDDAEVDFGTGDFTFDAWIYFVGYKSSTFTANATILDKLHEQVGGKRGYCFYVDAGELALKIGDGSIVRRYLSSITLPLGQWAHVAVTVKRDLNSTGGIKFYYNGFEYLGGNPNPFYGITISNDDNLQIGGTDFPSGWEYLDEVETFTRVLDQHEIIDIFNSDIRGKCKPPLILHGILEHLFCNGEPTGSIQVVVAGGVPEYSYMWSNGATSGTINSLGAGNYTVTVTDAYGTNAMAAYTITEPPALTIIPHVINVSCAGRSDGAIILTVTGGSMPYLFQWSNGFQTRDIFGLTAGNYSVIVTDGHGCAKTKTIAVLTDPPGKICGFKFIDKDKNGIYSGDDVKKKDWIIHLSGDATAVTTTDEDGNYCFNGLCPGNYRVSEVSQKYYTQSCPSNPRYYDIVLHSSETVTNINFGNQECVNAPIGMSNWWPLDEASGTEAKNIVQAANKGTGYGTPVPEHVPGKVSGALKFTSQTQYVLVKHDNELDIGTADFSIDAWINYQPPTSGPYKLFILNKLENNNLGYSFYVQDGRLGLTMGNQTSHTDYACTETLLPQQWNHVAVTVSRSDPAGIVFYINGNVCAGGNPTLYNNQWLSNNTDLKIGGMIPSGSVVQLDEIEIFTRVLSPQEVFDIFNSDENGKCKYSGRILGYKWQELIQNCSYDLVEPKLEKWEIVLTDGLVTRSTHTDNGGNYSFENLKPGKYEVSEVVKPLWEQKCPLNPAVYMVDVVNGSIGDKNFGNIYNPPDVVVGPAYVTNLTCNGVPTGAIEIYVFGGLLPYHYAWSNFGTSVRIVGLYAGQYTVTVTDANDATATGSWVVTEPPAVALSSTVQMAGCAGLADGSIDLSVTGGVLPYSFLWSNGAVSEDITGLTAGTYTVTVTDANGCAGTLSQVVAENPSPLLVITNPAPVCSPNRVDLTAAAVTAGSLLCGATLTYWTDAAATISMSTPSRAGNGTYYIKATTATGYYDIKPVIATVNALPIVFSVTGGGSYCAGGTGVLVGLSGTQTGVNYWLFVNFIPAGAPVAGTGYPVSFGMQTASGYYMVLAESTVTPCTNWMYNYIYISIDPEQPVSVTVVPSANPVAPGTLVTFTAVPVNGGSSPGYQWRVNGLNVGTNNPVYSYTPVDGDAVSCVLTSNVACASGNPATSNTVVMTVTGIPASVFVTGIAGSGQTECYDAIQTITVAGGGETFIVENGGRAIMIAGQGIYYHPGTLVEPGGYMNGLITSGGPWCGAKSASMVTAPSGEAGDYPASGRSFFTIYPNPTNGGFSLELRGVEETAELRVELYGLYGERLMTATGTGKRKYDFTLEGKPCGVYFIRVITGNHTGTGKIIKQ